MNDKRTIAAIKRYRTRKLAALLARSALLYRRKQYDKMANIICDEFVALGGIYIKFLQGVLLRSEVMKRWHNPNRLKIFENLESEPLDIGTYLQAELPPRQLSQIAMVQPQPFAAGSFGQVYFAQLKDGRNVIIKVLRPLTRELLKHDLRLLTAFYKRFFTRMYKNVDVDLDSLVNDFKKATLNETDYRHEAAFAHELFVAYKDHPKLVIPETFLELCTDDLIVQEYIDGVSVATLVKLAEQGVDPVRYIKDTLGSDLDKQLQTMGYEAILGIFTLPRIMGDPHPGNIRLLKDDRVGLIDFGISAQTPKDKAAFFGLIEAYDKMYKNSIEISGMFERALHFFVEDLYLALRRIGQHVGVKTLDNVTQVASDVFEQSYGTKLVMDDPKSDINMLMVINKAVNKGNRFGLIMKIENADILRATQTFISLVNSLGRSKQVTPKILDAVVKEVHERYPEYTNVADSDTSISDAIEIVSAWLERVAVRDPQLFRQLSIKLRAKESIISSGEDSA